MGEKVLPKKRSIYKPCAPILGVLIKTRAIIAEMLADQILERTEDGVRLLLWSRQYRKMSS